MRANYFTTFYFAGRELAISQLQNLASNFIDKLLVLNIFISDIISKTVTNILIGGCSDILHLVAKYTNWRFQTFILVA